MIHPTDRDLTPPDRRLKCLHGVPLAQDCPRCMASVSEPEWTEAEHEEIMRLHIAGGLTISDAKQRVFQHRSPSANRA